MAVSTDSLDPVFEEQLSRARERQSRDLSGREGRARVAVTGVAVVVAVALPLLTGSDRHPGWWLYLAFAVAYALVSSIQIEVGSGLALPTELVFVPMLFMLPAGRVPLVVLVGLLAAGLLEVARRRLSLESATSGSIPHMIGGLERAAAASEGARSRRARSLARGR